MLLPLLLLACVASSDKDTGSAEDCANGVDDDSDGLVDCEDGDCDGACTESDCADGVDDDGDGRTDCFDEDCLGTSDCPTTAARVTAGAMTLRHTRDWWGYYYGQGSTSIVSAVASGVGGTVQVDSRSCTWELAGMSAVLSRFSTSPVDYGSGVPDTFTSGTIVRTGLATSGACGLTGSWWLPQTLSFGSPGISRLDLPDLDSAAARRLRLMSGATWYGGVVTTSMRSSTLSTGKYATSGWSSWQLTQSFTVPELSSGATWVRE